MKSYLVCTVTLILLAGCAPKVWHKDGAVQRDYERDNTACKKRLVRVGGERETFLIYAWLLEVIL